MSRRREYKKKEGGGTPGWITTFSDLMSLLLTFFILLYSMSSVDAVKFKELSHSLQDVLTGSDSLSIIEGSATDDEILDLEQLSTELLAEKIEMTKEMQEMYNTVEEYISNKGLEAKVTVDMGKKGVYVDIKEVILFESGESELKSSGIQVLEDLQDLFVDFENDIVIEGHTDNIPIRNKDFESNWELSTSRALSVVKYLSEMDGLEPRRFSATGYGEYRPIVPNDSIKNRSINRRVNILIIFGEESDKLDG